MLNRRPLTFGLVFSVSTHLLEWIPIFFAAINQWDIGFFIGIAVVLARLITFFCLNLNVMTEADSWRDGYRFALGWLSISIVLLTVEFVLLSSSDIVSLLDPHSSFLTGLAYILFWIIGAIFFAVQVLIAGIQTLIRARRDHRATTTPAAPIN